MAISGKSRARTGERRTANCYSNSFAVRHALSVTLSSHPRADRAAHAGAAEAAIAVGIFRQILLVIALGEIERWGVADFGGDRPHPFGRERLGVGYFRRFGGGALLRRKRVDAGAVLGADVAALAHALG